MPTDQPCLAADAEIYAAALEQYPTGDGKYVAKVLREFLAKNVDRGDTFLLGDTADDRKVGYLMSIVKVARKNSQHFADLVYQLCKKKTVDPEGL